MPNERTLVRVNRRRPCPVCEKTWWCRVEKNGRYTICNRIESPRPARYGGEGWIHYPDSRDNNARAARPNYQTENESPRASPDWIAHVYRALLGHTSLEGRHQQALLARGFTEKEIRKRRYRKPGLDCARLPRLAGPYQPGGPASTTSPPGPLELFGDLAGTTGRVNQRVVGHDAEDSQVFGVRRRDGAAFPGPADRPCLLT
jgi:hypothetical protein